MTEITHPNHAVETVPSTLDVDPLTRFSEQYREGVAEGNPIACVDLGLCYLEGFGVSQDFAEAARLFRLSCDLDSNSTVGIPVDRDQAFWFVVTGDSGGS